MKSNILLKQLQHINVFHLTDIKIRIKTKTTHNNKSPTKNICSENMCLKQISISLKKQNNNNNKQHEQARQF
jgi:hypothetical protein